MIMRIALVLALSLVPGASAAQERPADFRVSETGFACLLDHLDAYLAQGSTVYVNFETCPARPSPFERAQAVPAQAFFPDRPATAEAGAAAPQPSEPEYRTVVAFTLPVLRCLAEQQDEVVRSAQNGSVALLPSACAQQ
jgi:hypothetical protein